MENKKIGKNMPRMRAKIAFVGFQVRHPNDSSVTYAKTAKAAEKKARAYEKDAEKHWQERFDSQAIDIRRNELHSRELRWVEDVTKSTSRNKNEGDDVREFAKHIYDSIRACKEDIEKRLERDGIYA